MQSNYDYEKQHLKGKLHAVERLDLLLDKDSFQEIGSRVQHSCTLFGMDKKDLPYDGVITGFGRVHGRPVAVYSQDFTVMSGTLGEMHGISVPGRIVTFSTKIGLLGHWKRDLAI